VGSSDRSVVVVGGGHGCARSLAALRLLDVAATAVVTVADDGGSSGRLRRDHDVVALGDLRMALLALADTSDGERGGGPERRTVAALASRRFTRGELSGHSLGNLLLLGLVEEHGGDLIAALETFGRLVGSRGRVLPVSLEPLTLLADTPSGTVAGQAAVATSRRIVRVQLRPDAPAAAPGVVEAIHAAELVLLGPGSLFTSVLPVLLVPEVAQALRSTAARVVHVGNLREQPGETEGMDLADHAEAIEQHVPGLRIDTVLAHEPGDTPAHGGGGARPLAIDERRLLATAGRVVRGDLGHAEDGHDPHRLARVLADLLERTGPAPSGPGTRSGLR